jgi:hypothetical protein
MANGLPDDKQVTVYSFGDDERAGNIARAHVRVQNLALQQWLSKHWPEMAPRLTESGRGGELLFITYTRSGTDGVYRSVVRYYPEGRQMRRLRRNR